MTIDLDKEVILEVNKLVEECQVNVPPSLMGFFKLIWIRAFHSGWDYATMRWTKMIDETLPGKDDIEKDLKDLRTKIVEQPR